MFGCKYYRFVRYWFKLYRDLCFFYVKEIYKERGYYGDFIALLVFTVVLFFLFCYIFDIVLIFRFFLWF